jgi:hypothetical protein
MSERWENYSRLFIDAYVKKVGNSGEKNCENQKSRLTLRKKYMSRESML